MKGEVKKAVIARLAKIKAKSEDGLLHTKDVVADAKNEKSPLHKHFTWDIRQAAAKCWEHEARRLIAIAVEIEPGLGENVRVYTSLHLDRATGGGYRETSEVLTRDDLHKALLSDFFKDLTTLRQRYVVLPQIEPIFSTASMLKSRLLGVETTGEEEKVG